jgi:hypothetical protein
MGYDVHITRRAWWADELGPSITAEDWASVAGSDASLRHSPGNGEGHYDYLDGDGWFAFSSRGDVYTKNPGDATMAKAHELAAKLRAKVQGDEGEVYLPNGERVGNEVREVAYYPFWLLLLCLFSVGCFVVVLLEIGTRW